VIETHDRRQGLRHDGDLFVATLAQQVEEENAALKRIDHVFRQRPRRRAGERCVGVQPGRLLER